MPHKAKLHQLERTQFLYHLDRDLARVSLRTTHGRFLRLASRRLGERLQADLVVQEDVRRSDMSLQPHYRLALGDPALAKTAAAQAKLQELEVELAEAGERILRGEPVGSISRNLLVFVASTDDREVAVLGFVRMDQPFSRGDLHFGQTVMGLISEKLTERDRERERRLRDKLSAKIFNELRPKDVLYQILHGLKKLLQYDHSASVLLLHPEGDHLTVQAEIIAWTKAKSDRIGLELPIQTSTRDWMANQEAPLLIRDGRPALDEGDAQALSGETKGALIPAELLDLPVAPNTSPPRSVLLGVLRRKDQTLGLVQILAKHAVAFTPENLVTLEKFLPLAAATVYNSELYARQQTRLVTAERKVGLGELARAISHDLNNSFGVMLPLLQATRRDLQKENADLKKLARDLEVIEHYASFSARIFGGLLSIGRGASQPYAWTNVNALLEATLAMIEPNLKAHRILLSHVLDPDVPSICIRKGEFEQVILNIIYNARDAMPSGGTLCITTSAEKNGIAIALADTGIGIEEDIREKIFEPFFTTKGKGTGLGLDICRSIVWEYGGTLELAPNEPRGTIASIWLPPSTERVPTDLLAAHGLVAEKKPEVHRSEEEPVVGYRRQGKKQRDRSQG